MSGKWDEVIRQTFGEYASEYLDVFAKECLSPKQLLSLSADDFRELRIRMGHREQLLKVAETFCASQARNDAIEQRRQRRNMLMTQPGVHDAALQQSLEATLKFTQSGRFQTSAEARRQAYCQSTLTVETLRNNEGVEWISCNGSARSCDEFLREMDSLIGCLGFTPATFLRLFQDNKPMPFAEITESPSGSVLIGLLLRVPDNTNQDGTSVTVITNRFVVLVSLDEGLIVTYQRAGIDDSGTHHPLPQVVPMGDTFRSEWDRGRHNNEDVGAVLECMLRKVLRNYEVAVAILRDSMDKAMNLMDEVQAVMQLTTIQKKASVFKRCATASRSALDELGTRDDCKELDRHVRALSDRLKTVESMCDELEANALSSVDLNIALAEFRSSTNLKIFTYITIVAQPVALATGWYGMNFLMPEFDDGNAYYIFTPAVWLGAIALLSFILWREKKLLRLRMGTKDKTAQRSALTVSQSDEDGGLLKMLFGSLEKRNSEATKNIGHDTAAQGIADGQAANDAIDALSESMPSANPKEHRNSPHQVTHQGVLVLTSETLSKGGELSLGPGAVAHSGRRLRKSKSVEQSIVDWQQSLSNGAIE